MPVFICAVSARIAAEPQRLDPDQQLGDLLADHRIVAEARAP